jgi:hypothetical protein
MTPPRSLFLARADSNAIYAIPMSETPQCSSEWIHVLELKAAGNQLFKNGEFGACIEPYSHAIELAAQLSFNQSEEESASQLSERVVLLSNRAAAYLKLMQPHLALVDCELCISLSPRFVKGIDQFCDAIEAFILHAFIIYLPSLSQVISARHWLFIN